MIGFSTILLIFIAFFFTRRNFFNKHKYVRLEEFRSDKSIKVKYIKRELFNADGKILVNPDHIFNFKGYTTIVKSSNSAESMNPLNFNSKYPAKKFETAIESKVISDTFNSLKKPKLDMLTIIAFLSGLNLLVLVYMVMKGMGAI